MRILHLGFEDHRRPGAGGGSYRNYEINRRLARKHKITVITAAYPGCVDRDEEGVHYRHVGYPGSFRAALLTYFAALPAVVRSARRTSRVDLIVEEFAPPVSTIGVAGWSGLPTCANVQWLFAADKAREYGLPPWTMDRIERWGVRHHRSFVVLTGDLRDQILALNSTANVIVNGMGVAVPEPGFQPPVIPRSSLFLGRLDIDHKGLDLMLDALVLMPRDATYLRIAGDGRGRQALEERVRELGLSNSVQFVGRVTGEAKWRLLAESQVVVMPSRRETFGLSALEALACNRPVLSFDIPCLREVVRPEHGVLVTPFNTRAYAAAWLSLLADPANCHHLGANGARFARNHTWDSVAAVQAATYQSILDAQG